ncbi:mechanosensitive ion channel family protein [Corynebacterium pilosum]|uniref:Small-conductance mechanosensitive channel n=1 Tax=Corynebacterium pilosum TaxID=35756 RepID=A0A376CRL6_9CORY|nr:mechanosensitive ion channel family protein [Corynebacterium pilosum]STC70278.1 small-conductance mechanosensitive channel [Corynebacterium pilosum]
MPFEYLFASIWRWIADSGLNIAILVVIAFLVPRAGRLATRVLERRVQEEGDKDEGKSKLALAGVGVYVAELIAFFIIAVMILQEFGFSLAGAAIPATVVSAAVGFGAQSIIADFLAGFFILSEKQYGVGDWVAFTGNGVDVEGTVIQITMRSTQIRTIDQSTVNIPNSTARVAINRSNYWSRAVVVMPVPLLGSSSAKDALRRSEGATRRALARPEIASEVIGELDVHPAVNVDPPATVGMPWTVDMRFMTQVKAGSQWLVERAIRMSILDEFWDEYGSATTMDGTLIQEAKTSSIPATRATIEKLDDEAPTEMMPTASAPDADPETEVIQATGTDSDQPDVPPEFETDEGKDPAVKDAEQDVTADEGQEDEDDDTTDKKRSTFRDILTAGRRMRPSTAILLLVLLVLLILRGLTASGTYNDEHVSGVLAPPPLSSTESTPPPPTEDVAPEPTPPAEPTAPTGTPAPTATSGPAAPGQTTQPQGTDGGYYQEPGQQNSPQQQQSQAPAAPTNPAQQQQPTAGNDPQQAPQETGGAAPMTAPAQTANPVR